MLKNQDVADVLDSISSIVPLELWNKLPSGMAGEEWVGEIQDCVVRMAEYLPSQEGEISEEWLRDLHSEFANSACEDYYANIHEQNHNLSLWAITALDDEVQELNSGVKEFPTMVELEAQYLYAAMSILWSAVAEYVVEAIEGE